VGRISHFGLMEMSRQRLRPGILEGSSRPCPHCEGRGIVRSISSCGLSVLRAIEEHLMNRKAEHLTVKCSREIASYVLNDKRDNLLSLEQAYGISVFIVPSDEVKGSQAVIERAGDRNIVIRKAANPPVKVDSVEEEDEEIEDVVEADADEAPIAATPEVEAGEEDGEGQRGKRRRRGRRGGRRGGREREDGVAASGESDGEAVSEPHGDEPEDVSAAPAAEPTEAENGERGPSRRRDRWGRNRNGRNRNGRNGAEGDSNGHTERVAVEASEPQAERPAPVHRPEPVAAPIEIISQPVEIRKWQPPAATVPAPEAVAKPKAGWWSKRG
jgi:ribonuclease E